MKHVTFTALDHARIQHWTWEFPTWCQPPSRVSPPKNKSPRWIRWKSEKKGRLKFGLKKDSQLLNMDGWNRIQQTKLGQKALNCENKTVSFLGRVSWSIIPPSGRHRGLSFFLRGAHNSSWDFQTGVSSNPIYPRWKKFSGTYAPSL